MEARRGEATLREILDQKRVLEAVLRLMAGQQPTVDKLTDPVDTVVFTGCGSNYYMALAAAAHYQGITGKPAIGIAASEILLFPELVFAKGRNCLLVALSRSGSTTEVVEAVRRARQQHGVECLAIGCDETSPLSRISTARFMIPEGLEQSVCTTKSFSGMLLAAQLFATMKARDGKRVIDLKKVVDLCDSNIALYEAQVRTIALREDLTEFVFLGSGPLYGIACEGKMKLKEMALLPSDAFHCLEYRHGPRAVVTPRFLVTLLLSDAGQAQELALLKELKELGAAALVVCDQASDDIRACADYLISLGTELDDYAKGVAFVPFLQLLAYFKAASRGIDTDAPRNLAYFVRLELNS